MSLKEEKILIVDDDSTVRLATRMNLEMAGYHNILSARNGDLALQLIHKNKPALVLLDRKMPGKDGLEVLDEIKEIYGDDIEVIMLTAYRDKDYVTEAMRRGAFYYLVKDEHPDFTLKIIEDALRYHRKLEHRNVIERKFYESLIQDQDEDLIKNGYDFEAFKKVITDNIDRLVEEVIHKEITDCAGCIDCVCQSSKNSSLSPLFDARPLIAEVGDGPPVFIMHRKIGDPFFERVVSEFVPERQRRKVQTVIYVPFIDQPSPPLLKFLQQKIFSDDLLRYGCIYIFSAKVLKLTPEERRLLRRFFERFLMAMRVARLVDKIDSLNRYQILSEMAAMVVHYISPLITPLIDCLENFNANKQRQGLTMINELRHMVDEFREYSNGIVKDYQFTRIDLAQVIGQAENLLFGETEEPIEICHHFPAHPVEIEGDASRLRQVFLNLFLNASQAIAQARPEKGKIDVEMIVKERQVEIHVIDNGAGVQPEIASKLFNFCLSTKKGGVGLGLCLAAEIVRRHGGKIAHHLEYFPGAEFIVTLPLATA